MAQAGDVGRDILSDDDLIEIHVGRVGRPDPEVLILNAPLPSSFTRPSRPHNGRRREPEQLPRSRETTVIDLTEEPDSPVQSRLPQLALPGMHNHPHQQQVHVYPRPPGRNPRRTNSVRITPPRLARSESIVLASESEFIDLTGDDDINPSNPPGHMEEGRRSRRNNRLPRLRPDAPYSWDSSETRPPRDFQSIARAIGESQIARAFGESLAGILNASSNMPRLHGIRFHHFTTRAHPSPYPIPPREPSKPPLEEYPPARDGFTRNTCANPEADDETIVVCPSCNDEMAYDPADVAGSSAPATTGKKRKRAHGEHHFWALKKCGHVSDFDDSLRFCIQLMSS